MPTYRKRRYAKKAPRRRYKRYPKNRSRYAKPASITRIRDTGFPDRLYTKLKYVDQLNLNPGNPATVYTYRGNSCFDPDLTGTGHQPLFFDQYIAVYGKYRVLGSSIKVQVNNSQNATVACLIIPTTTPQTFTTISQYLEQNKASVLRMVPINSQSSSMQKRYMSTTKATGANRGAVKIDDEYAAVFSANPVNLWYWNIFLQSLDQTTAVRAQLIVSMTFYVEFFDRENVAQS